MFIGIRFQSIYAASDDILRMEKKKQHYKNDSFVVFHADIADTNQ